MPHNHGCASGGKTNWAAAATSAALSCWQAVQDRSRWDMRQISEGLALLDRALALRAPGPYQIQAAISALHVDTKTAVTTDWPQIAALYGGLMALVHTPIVALNHAIAIGMAYGPERGLALLAPIDLPFTSVKIRSSVTHFFSASQRLSRVYSVPLTLT